MKTVLSVQDLSCVGRCSLTVALPVLSAMGCRCAALPTAVLSTHTAFPQPFVHSLTEDIVPICHHWQKNGVAFDAVSVGYLSDPAQAAAVQVLLSSFAAPVVLDPVMGDHGRLYSGITPEHVDALKSLCRSAQVLLPNITEGALLTGLPYRQIADSGYYREMLSALQELGPQTVILTGVSGAAGEIGFSGCSREEGFFTYHTPRIPKMRHGTGDLFTAVFTGAFARGLVASRCAALAAGFVERAIASSGEETLYGVDFEPQLPWLWEQLKNTEDSR